MGAALVLDVPGRVVALLLLTSVFLGSGPLRAAPPDRGPPAPRPAEPGEPPREWARARKVLLDKPAHTLDEVAGMLRMDKAALVRLIDRHEGREPLNAARRLALAKRLAARAPGFPEGTTFRDVPGLVADELPHLHDPEVARLKRQHPEILKALEPRGLKRLPKPARDRVRALAFVHPTLSHAELASLYGRDRALRGVNEWTEAQVDYLRWKSRVVPAERVRLRHFAGVAAGAIAGLTDQAGGATLDDAVALLGREHPHVDADLLLRLAADEPRLAQAIRRLAPVAPAAPSRTRIDRALAQRIGFAAPLLERSLARPGSPLVKRVAGEAAELVKTAGYGDDVLMPNAVDRAAPARLKGIIRAVWRRTGKKALSLAEVEAALPAAIAEVAKEAGGELYREAVEDALDDLEVRYRAEVILGGQAPSTWFVHRGIASRDSVRLRKLVPERFPDLKDVPLEGDRLEAVARFYAELLAGRLTMTGFYKRAAITAAQLRVLQGAHPDLFPRPEDTPVFRTLRGRKNVQLTEAEIDALSVRWIADVVHGGMSVVDFEKASGIPKKRLADLRREHPDKFPPPGTRDDQALATLAGAKATAIFDADVLVKTEQIRAALNRDRQVLALNRGKPISRARYEELQRMPNAGFPRLSDRKLVFDRLAAELREILAREGKLSPAELTRRMKVRHPSFKRVRIDQLREAYEGLVPESAPERKTAAQRRADAEYLAERMGEGASIPEVAEELGVPPAHLHRLRRDFEKELFSAGALARRPPDKRRSTTAMAELYSLAIRLAPPGTGEEGLRRMLNRLLVARGLPPYPGKRVSMVLVRQAQATHGTLEERQAQVTAEVIAEYARAAPSGTSEADLVALVQRDYPTLDAFKMSTYARMWRQDPRAYPALAPFLRRGQLRLTGRGERGVPRRYRGGWDLERALFAPSAHDPALAAELARYSEYARIPSRLPLLDEMVQKLGPKKPLRGQNVLWVSHLLGSSVPLARALAQAGLLVKSTIVVGTPYGTNPAVRRTLEGEGFDVRVPALSVAEYKKAVRKALDDMADRHRQNHKPVVVLDDGGLVAELLHGDERYADVRHAFKIVEQTTRGITAAEGYSLGVPIVNVAQSKTKQAEAEFIGKAVARKLVQGLGRLERRAAGAKVTVVGYGNVGRAIARELLGLGAQVTVVESSGARAREAAEAGFDVRGLEDAVEGADIVVGASGTTSIKLEHLRKLKSGAIVASASSKRLEIDMEALEAASTLRTPIAARSPLVRLPSASYKLGRRTITVLGDGWPVNFDGDVEDLDAEEIQLTRAAMFAGALQAASIHINHRKNRGLVPLDAKVDAWILKRFRQLSSQPRTHGIHDPDRWLDVLRDVAKIAGGET